MLTISTRPLTEGERRMLRWVWFGPVAFGLVYGPVVAACVYGMLALPIVVLIAGAGALLTRQWTPLWAIPICILGLWVIGFLITMPQSIKAAVKDQRLRTRELRGGIAEVLTGSGEWAWDVCRDKKDQPTSTPTYYYAVDGDTLVTMHTSLPSPLTAVPMHIPSRFVIELLPLSRHVLGSRCDGPPIPVFDALDERAGRSVGILFLAPDAWVFRRRDLDPHGHGVFERPTLG